MRACLLNSSLTFWHVKWKQAFGNTNDNYRAKYTLKKQSVKYFLFCTKHQVNFLNLAVSSSSDSFLLTCLWRLHSYIWLYESLPWQSQRTTAHFQEPKHLAHSYRFFFVCFCSSLQISITEKLNKFIILFPAEFVCSLTKKWTVSNFYSTLILIGQRISRKQLMN